MRDQNTLILKDPQSIEPYGFDWTEWLAELSANETIVDSVWAVTKGGSALTLSDDEIVTGLKKTQVTLTAGTKGTQYTVTNSIVTSGGFQDDRSLRVLVQNQ